MHICIYYLCTDDSYRVASVSRIDKIIGLFCKRALYKNRYSAKETYNLIDPTDRSHPTVEATRCTHVYLYMCVCVCACVCVCVCTRNADALNDSSMIDMTHQCVP